MSKKLRIVVLMGLILAFLLPATSIAQDDVPVYYWISHGDPADPVWIFFLGGAEQWAEDTGFEVRTSFHSGDVPSHQEAMRAAIAAGATGIVTSTETHEQHLPMRPRGLLQTLSVAYHSDCEAALR